MIWRLPRQAPPGPSRCHPLLTPVVVRLLSAVPLFGQLTETQINPANGFQNDEFGTSVSVSGDTAVVGAPGDSYNVAAGPAAAYIYRSLDNSVVVQTFGNSCPSLGGPSLVVAGQAILGTPAFGFVVNVHGAAPGATAALLFSTGLAALETPAASGCFLHPAQPLRFIGFLPVSAVGTLSLPIEIPANPALAGLDIFMQHLVLDNSGPVGPNIASLSEGLWVRLGL